MRPYDKDKSQILAMFYYGVPIEDIKRFYKGKEQQYLFDTALMQLESEGMIKREGESFVVTKEAGDAFLCYGNYLKYVEAKRRQQVDNEKAKVLDSKVKKSTIVSNYLESANMVCSIVSFIVGVLLSDQVKWILNWLLSFFLTGCALPHS